MIHNACYTKMQCYVYEFNVHLERSQFATFVVYRVPFLAVGDETRR